DRVVPDHRRRTWSHLRLHVAIARPTPALPPMGCAGVGRMGAAAQLLVGSGPASAPEAAAASRPRYIVQPSMWSLIASRGRSRWVNCTRVPAPSGVSANSTSVLPGGIDGSVSYPKVKLTLV